MAASGCSQPAREGSDAAIRTSADRSPPRSDVPGAEAGGDRSAGTVRSAQILCGRRTPRCNRRNCTGRLRHPLGPGRCHAAWSVGTFRADRDPRSRLVHGRACPAVGSAVFGGCRRQGGHRGTRHSAAPAARSSGGRGRTGRADHARLDPAPGRADRDGCRRARDRRQRRQSRRAAARRIPCPQWASASAAGPKKPIRARKR